MKIEVWHLKANNEYKMVHELEISSVSDESSCELAYIHTGSGSITNMHQPEVRGMDIGDIIAVHVSEDDCRAYKLVEFDGAKPIFQKTESDVCNY
jgi:hypothetical protein